MHVDACAEPLPDAGSIPAASTTITLVSLAQMFYSHKQLHKKDTNEMQEMIFQKGTNWNDTPNVFKRGTWLRRRKIMRTLTPEERATIPEHHRPAPETRVERTEIIQTSLPQLTQLRNPELELFGMEG